ncbi:MAG: DUF368 domain-containing protein [Verrucomicrobia bacterium]|nr:DUF368 domain-containing protein [Verrucomicrobiota bacterium]
MTNILAGTLLLLLKGVAMGIANAIPGVSGGTIAFVTGIYERLINAIKSFDLKALTLLRKLKFQEFLAHIQFFFLLPLGTGVLTGLVGSSYALKQLFKTHELYVWSFFFGLIVASIVPVGTMVKKWGVAPVVSLLVGAAIAIGIAMIGAAEENRNVPYLVVCGVVAIASMILPGISGSYVLILLGNYNLIMLESITNLGDGLKAMEWPKIKEALSVIIPVGVGCVFGIALLSRFLSWLFRRFHDAAVALMTGFVIGSLLVIWPWKKKIPLLDESGAPVIKKSGKEVVTAYERYLPDFSDNTTWIAIGVMVIACVIVIAMEKFGSKRSDA